MDTRVMALLKAFAVERGISATGLGQGGEIKDSTATAR